MNESEIRLHSGALLPPRLVETVSAWDQGVTTPGWLAGLPATVAELCQKWRIEIEPVFPETYVTLVLLGNSADLGPVAIKSSPLAEEFRAEATALALAAGDRVARIYDVDLDRSVMVMERIVPGTQLREVPMSDHEATRLGAESVAGMWRPVPDPSGLHPLRRWMRVLFEWRVDAGPIDPDLIRHAQELGESLLANSSRSCLLHGDFQHHNLLQRANGEWVIIDPKGVYGDPGFEFAAWMYNPPGVTERDDYLALAKRRIEICSSIWQIDRDRLAAWAFVGMVLSMCWSAANPARDERLRHCERAARELSKLL